MTEIGENVKASKALGPAPLTADVFSKPAGGSEWVASRYRDVQAVLADERFEVGTVPQVGAVGSVAWLRASVSRFVNGAEHQRRRQRVEAELRRLDPQLLRSDCYRRACVATQEAGHPGERMDVMALLARQIPMAAVAGMLGVADPTRAAQAVIALSAGYFPGSDPSTQPAADGATAQLVSMLEPAHRELIVSRIALMVQGCDATAGLIGNSLYVLKEAQTAKLAAIWSTESLLWETLRRHSPLRASRRLARESVEFQGRQLAAGAAVVCAVDVANQDPLAFSHPTRFDPGRVGPASLTFGYGVRPCPGQAQALGLAAGVVDAVREHCSFVLGQPQEYEPSTALRIPARLEVVLS
ncbi:MAG: cytochrome P450 [Candidatus Dormiibacterota bacterium]